MLRSYILWCLSEIFCRYLLSPFKSSVSSLISLLSFCVSDLSVGESGVLNSPTISVWGLIFDILGLDYFTWDDFFVVVSICL